MSDMKNFEFEKKDINLAALLRNMVNLVYEYNNDVEIILSKKYVKRLLKGLRNVSIHKNNDETIAVVVANNVAADTNYMIVLVGDNKTQLFKVKQIETNDKQYLELNKKANENKTHKILFSEQNEIRQAKRK